MLGFFKRAHAETAVSLRLDQVKAMLSSFCGPISASTWRNHYLTGYLAGAFHTLLKISNPPNTNPGYIGLQSGRLWQAFTGLPASQFQRDVLVLADNEDRDFLRGFDRGLLWAAAVTGKVNRQHPEIAALLLGAQEKASTYERVYGEPSHHMADVASMLLIGDFFQKAAQANQFAR